MTYSLLTITDIMKMLRVSKATVYNLIKRGQIPSPIKIGGGTRWRNNDIESYITALEPVHSTKEVA